MVTILPPHPGYLPLWILFTSALSIFNSIQAYTNVQLTKRVYSGRPSDVTALSARTFGTWTITSAIVRLYGAYNISDPRMYQLVLFTKAIAFAHFLMEWRIYRTTVWGSGLAGPIFVSTGTLIWMLTQWSFYVS
ncbi:MAG: ergosterol biosynthesis protein [Peltula sp. TS41687]|nr:MAG: ergosterol biosynthesis protein [Peltula sp. TS41687]